MKTTPIPTGFGPAPTGYVYIGGYAIELKNRTSGPGGKVHFDVNVYRKQ